MSQLLLGLNLHQPATSCTCCLLQTHLQPVRHVTTYIYWSRLNDLHPPPEPPPPDQPPHCGPKPVWNFDAEEGSTRCQFSIITAGPPVGPPLQSPPPPCFPSIQPNWQLYSLHPGSGLAPPMGQGSPFCQHLGGTHAGLRLACDKGGVGPRLRLGRRGLANSICSARPSFLLPDVRPSLLHAVRMLLVNELIRTFSKAPYATQNAWMRMFTGERRP